MAVSGLLRNLSSVVPIRPYNGILIPNVFLLQYFLQDGNLEKGPVKILAKQAGLSRASYPRFKIQAPETIL